MRRTLPYGLVTLERKPCVKLSTPFLAVESGGSDVLWEVQGETRRGFRWTVTRSATTRSLKEKVDQIRKRRSQSKEKKQSHPPTTEDCPPVLNRFDIEHDAKIKKRKSSDVQPPVLNEDGKLYNMIQEIGSKKDRILQIKLQRGSKSSVSNSSEAGSDDIWNIVKRFSESDGTECSVSPQEHVSEQCVHEDLIDKMPTEVKRKTTSPVISETEHNLSKYAEDTTNNPEILTQTKQSDVFEFNEESMDKPSRDEGKQSQSTDFGTNESDQDLSSVDSIDVAGNSFESVEQDDRFGIYHKNSTIPKTMKPFLKLKRIDSDFNPKIRSVSRRASHNRDKATDRNPASDTKVQNKVDENKFAMNPLNSVVTKSKHEKERTNGKETHASILSDKKNNNHVVSKDSKVFEKCVDQSHRQIDAKETRDKKSKKSVNQEKTGKTKDSKEADDNKNNGERPEKLPEKSKMSKTKNSEMLGPAPQKDQSHSVLKPVKKGQNPIVNTKNQELNDKNFNHGKSTENNAKVKPKADKGSFEDQLGKIDALLLTRKIRITDSDKQTSKNKETRVQSPEQPASINKSTDAKCNADNISLDTLAKDQQDLITNVYDTTDNGERNSRRTMSSKKSRAKGRSKSDTDKWKSFDITVVVKRSNSLQDTKHNKKSLNSAKMAPTDRNQDNNCVTAIARKEHSSQDINKPLVSGRNTLREIDSVMDTSHKSITDKLQCDYMAALQLGPAMPNATKAAANVLNGIKQTVDVAKKKPLIEKAPNHGNEVISNKPSVCKNVSNIVSDDFYSIMVGHIETEQKTTEIISKRTHYVNEKQTRQTVLNSGIGSAVSPSAIRNLGKSVSPPAGSVAPSILNVTPNLPSACKNTSQSTSENNRNPTHNNQKDMACIDKVNPYDNGLLHKALTSKSNFHLAPGTPTSKQYPLHNPKDPRKNRHDTCLSEANKNSIDSRTVSNSALVSGQGGAHISETTCGVPPSEFTVENVSTTNKVPQRRITVENNKISNKVPNNGFSFENKQGTNNVPSAELTVKNKGDTTKVPAGRLTVETKQSSNKVSHSRVAVENKHNAKNVSSSGLTSGNNQSTSKVPSNGLITENKQTTNKMFHGRTDVDNEHNTKKVSPSGLSTGNSQNTSKVPSSGLIVENRQTTNKVLHGRTDVDNEHNTEKVSPSGLTAEKNQSSSKMPSNGLTVENKQNTKTIPPSEPAIENKQSAQKCHVKNPQADENVRLKHNSGSDHLNRSLSDPAVSLPGTASTKVDAETAKRLQRFLQRSISEVHKNKLLPVDSQGIHCFSDKSNNLSQGTDQTAMSKGPRDQGVAGHSSAKVDKSVPTKTHKSAPSKTDKSVPKKTETNDRNKSTKYVITKDASQKKTNSVRDINSIIKHIPETVHRPTLHRSDSQETVIGGINDLTVPTSFASPLDDSSDGQIKIVSDDNIEHLHKSLSDSNKTQLLENNKEKSNSAPDERKDKRVLENNNENVNESSDDQPLDLTVPKVRHEIITYPLDLSKKKTDVNEEAPETHVVNNQTENKSVSKSETTVSDKMDKAKCENSVPDKNENIPAAPSTKDTQSEITKTLHQLSQVLQEISKLSEENVENPGDEMVSTNADTNQKDKATTTKTGQTKHTHLNTKNVTDAQSSCNKSVNNKNISFAELHDPKSLQKSIKTESLTKDADKLIPGHNKEKQNTETEDVQAMRDLYLNADNSHNNVEVSGDESYISSSNLIKIRERHKELQRRKSEKQNIENGEKQLNTACKEQISSEDMLSARKYEKVMKATTCMPLKQTHIKSEPATDVFEEANVSDIHAKSAELVPSDKSPHVISTAAVKKESLCIDGTTTLESSCILEQENTVIEADKNQNIKDRKLVSRPSENKTLGLSTDSADHGTELVASALPEIVHAAEKPDTDQDKTVEHEKDSKSAQIENTDKSEIMSHIPKRKEYVDIPPAKSQIDVSKSQSTNEDLQKLHTEHNKKEYTIHRECPHHFDCHGEADVGLLESFGTPFIKTVKNNVEERQMHQVSNTEAKQGGPSKEVAEKSNNEEENKSSTSIENTASVNSETPIRRQFSVSSIHKRKHAYGSQKGWLNRDGRFISGIKKPQKDKEIHYLTLTKPNPTESPKVNAECKEKDVTAKHCIGPENATDKEFVALCIDELLKSERQKSNTYSLPNTCQPGEQETTMKVQQVHEETNPDLISDKPISEHTISKSETTTEIENKAQLRDHNEEKKSLQSERTEKSAMDNSVANEPKDPTIKTFEELKKWKCRNKMYYRNRPYMQNKARRFQFNNSGMRKNQTRSNTYNNDDGLDKQPRDEDVDINTKTDHLNNHDNTTLKNDSENKKPKYDYRLKEQEGKYKDDTYDRKSESSVQERNAHVESKIQISEQTKNKDNFRNTYDETENEYPDKDFNDDVYNGYDAFQYRPDAVIYRKQAQTRSDVNQKPKGTSMSNTRKRSPQKRLKNKNVCKAREPKNGNLKSVNKRVLTEAERKAEREKATKEIEEAIRHLRSTYEGTWEDFSADSKVASFLEKMTDKLATIQIKRTKIEEDRLKEIEKEDRLKRLKRENTVGNNFRKWQPRWQWVGKSGGFLKRYVPDKHHKDKSPDKHPREYPVRDMKETVRKEIDKVRKELTETFINKLGNELTLANEISRSKSRDVPSDTIALPHTVKQCSSRSEERKDSENRRNESDKRRTNNFSNKSSERDALEQNEKHSFQRDFSSREKRFPFIRNNKFYDTKFNNNWYKWKWSHQNDRGRFSKYRNNLAARASRARSVFRHVPHKQTADKGKPKSGRDENANNGVSDRSKREVFEDVELNDHRNNREMIEDTKQNDRYSRRSRSSNGSHHRDRVSDFGDQGACDNRDSKGSRSRTPRSQSYRSHRSHSKESCETRESNKIGNYSDDKYNKGTQIKSEPGEPCENNATKEYQILPDAKTALDTIRNSYDSDTDTKTEHATSRTNRERSKRTPPRSDKRSSSRPERDYHKRSSSRERYKSAENTYNYGAYYKRRNDYDDYGRDYSKDEYTRNNRDPKYSESRNRKRSSPDKRSETPEKRFKLYDDSYDRKDNEDRYNYKRDYYPQNNRGRGYFSHKSNTYYQPSRGHKNFNRGHHFQTRPFYKRGFRPDFKKRF